jgi:branched-chain amino acid transport system ATP-binding protein
VMPGERHAVIGPNGAGKSTLFHLISGRLRPDDGEILFDGRPITGLPPHVIFNTGLARSFQVTSLFPKLSVFENLRAGAMRAHGCGLAFWRMLDGYAPLRRRTEEVMELIGLERRRDVPAGSLAYAEQRALEIGVTIAGGATTILLDEPTAGMSRAETERAVTLIRRVSEGRTLVMIEHDLGVVFDLADRISVLAEGRIIATGAPDAIRADRAVQTAYLGAAAETLCA